MMNDKRSMMKRTVWSYRWSILESTFRFWQRGDGDATLTRQVWKAMMHDDVMTERCESRADGSRFASVHFLDDNATAR